MPAPEQTPMSRTLLSRSGLPAVLMAALSGCAGSKGETGLDTGGSGESTPTVVSNSPLASATGVAINAGASATFSEAMDPAGLGAAFELTGGDPAVAVAGTVVYADSTATFWPAEHLETDTLYTATISTSAASALGVPLAADHVWTFTTGTALGSAAEVPLGSAADYVILAKSGVSTVPTSAITGDVGVSPVAASALTGFSLSVDASNQFATAAQVVGALYAADYAPPTPTRLTTAVADMERAYVDAAGRAPDVTELGAGDIGGLDLPPGVYRWGTGLTIPTDLTLTGGAADVWIFEIAQDLTLASGARVSLAGGALPAHVYWQVAGSVELGTASHLEGVVLTQTTVVMRTGASLRGRLLAQTAVALDANVVTEP
jgi:hypothetical protein